MYVRDGRIVYHKGNSRAPNNIGSRCAKGMASWWVAQDPDRLKYPMLRNESEGRTGSIFAGHRGTKRWTSSAGKLAEIKEQWGPEAVAFTCHHDPNTVFYWTLLRDLYGSPNHVLTYVGVRAGPAFGVLSRCSVMSFRCTTSSTPAT